MRWGRVASGPVVAAGLIGGMTAGGCAGPSVWRTPGPDSHAVEARPWGKGGACVRVGSRSDGCFEAVSMSALALSPDGRHAAYPALRNGSWTVVRDGVVGASWDGVASLAFSSNGQHLAYAALEGRSWRVVTDERAGAPHAPHDSLIAGSIRLSPEGSRTAYAVARGAGASVVVDGVGGEASDAVGPVRFDPSGAHFAYTARSETGAFMVIDHKRASARRTEVSDPAWSPDGRRLAWAAKDDDAWWVIERGVGAPAPTEEDAVAGPYRSVRNVGYLPGGGVLYYIAGGAGAERAVVAGTTGPPYDSISELAVSATADRWGYVARAGDRSLVILNGAVIATEERASNLVFSLDGQRYAYIAGRRDRAHVVDPTGAHPFDLLIGGTLVFTGQSWACIAGDREKKKLFVVAEKNPKRRRVEWSDVARIARRGMGETGEYGGAIEMVRSWVAAEAAAMQPPRSAAR